MIFKKRLNGTIDKFIDNEFVGNFYPNDDSNPNSIEFDSWLLEGNAAEYSNLENLESAKLLKINQCKTYLNNTDWQIIALTERNRVVDEDVATNRPLAVSLQAEITACTTLEELNNININFE